MNESLEDIAKALAAPGKGILAADESVSTAGKRLASVGVENTEENRRLYRDVFLTAEGIEKYLSGVILYDETFGQRASNGESFVKLLAGIGVMPGIKVDMSTVPFPNFSEELFTQGLDGLAERLQGYADGGAKFTKWRTVIHISDELPSETTLMANMHGLAHYAALVQAAGMVPMVEPEVLYEGDHSIEKAQEVTTHTLSLLFDTLQQYNVNLEGVVLKSSMVLAGSNATVQSMPDSVASATLATFTASVPHEVPSIVFLSGGQEAQQATDNLRAITTASSGPWQISFSFARALQGSALKVWAGKEENMAAAQEEFMNRLRATSAAQQGK